MGLGIAIGVIVVLVFAGIGTYNGINVARLKVKESLSGIDVALTKRYDVLTKMLDVVKGYQQHEKELMTELVSLRNGMSMKERNEANANMTQVTDQIRLMVENYPELKSNTNFLQLQNTIVDVEEHLQAARRLYNSNVTAYNTKIITFPSSIIAGMMGAREEEFFQAEEVKRSDVKMSF